MAEETDRSIRTPSHELQWEADAPAPHAVHPQALERMARIASTGEPPLDTLPPAEARRLADARVGDSGLPAVQLAEVRDIALDGPGGVLPLRLYRPTGDGRAPLVMFYHGGGFMVANLETHDALCRLLAARSGAALLAVDYRLAPENKFPAAPIDCLFATEWALDHADELGVDASRVALAGESSGGNLAAVVAQQLRTRRPGVEPQLQVLVYAMLDAGTDTSSYRTFADGYFFTRRKARYFIDHYLAAPEDADDPRVSPLRAPSFEGLPPALIVTAGLDPLLSEAEDYAARLREAGVPVAYRCFEGWPHGFLFWGGTEAATDAVALVSDALARALGTDKR